MESIVQPSKAIAPEYEAVAVATKDGRVIFAKILDQQRYKTDAAWREVALSARNAVLLSSPFSLPAGHYKTVMDMTLRFDPKDALH